MSNNHEEVAVSPSKGEGSADMNLEEAQNVEIIQIQSRKKKIVRVAVAVSISLCIFFGVCAAAVLLSSPSSFSSSSPADNRNKKGEAKSRMENDSNVGGNNDRVSPIDDDDHEEVWDEDHELGSGARSYLGTKFPKRPERPAILQEACPRLPCISNGFCQTETAIQITCHCPNDGGEEEGRRRRGGEGERGGGGGDGGGEGAENDERSRRREEAPSTSNVAAFNLSSYSSHPSPSSSFSSFSSCRYVSDPCGRIEERKGIEILLPSTADSKEEEDRDVGDGDDENVDGDDDLHHPDSNHPRTNPGQPRSANPLLIRGDAYCTDDSDSAFVNLWRLKDLRLRCGNCEAEETFALVAIDVDAADDILASSSASLPPPPPLSPHRSPFLVAASLDVSGAELRRDRGFRIFSTRKRDDDDDNDNEKSNDGNDNNGNENFNSNDNDHFPEPHPPESTARRRRMQIQCPLKIDSTMMDPVSIRMHRIQFLVYRHRKTVPEIKLRDFRGRRRKAFRRICGERIDFDERKFEEELNLSIFKRMTFVTGFP